MSATSAASAGAKQSYYGGPACGSGRKATKVNKGTVSGTQIISSPVSRPQLQ